MTILMFDDAGRVKAHAKYETDYLKNNENIMDVEESELAAVFENAQEAGETLDGTDESIDAAVDNPLRFTDYLVNANGSVEFDGDYTRDTTA